MSTLQEVETAISKFTLNDLIEFRNWYDNFDSQKWDNQFENDVKSGKLENLGKLALADFNNHKCKEL